MDTPTPNHIAAAVRCAQVEAAALVNEKCDVCGRNLHIRDNVSSFAGLGVQKICYDCVGRMDVQTMMAGFPIVLYFVEPSHPSPPLNMLNAHVVNYCQTLIFDQVQAQKSKHNIGRTRWDVWFIGPDGAKWHGVNIGDNQILRCKRNKRQNKNLLPLQESQYMRPYPYETSKTR